MKGWHPRTLRTLFPAAALALALAACSDSASHTKPDGGDGSDGGSAVDGGDGPAPGEPREVVAGTHFRSCVGCVQVSWCGLPPASDLTVVTLDAAPNTTTGLFFAAERWNAAGRALPVDTCSLLTGAQLEAVLDPIQGVEVLDAGAISIDPGMPGWEAPLIIEYSDVTHNYPSVAARLGQDGRQWVPGTSVALAATGGAAVASFDAAFPAPEGLEILTPHTDQQGKIDNVPVGEPLQVTWSGGGDFDTLVMFIESYWCPWDVVSLVLCHLENDGAFTVPAGVMEAIEWPNLVELTIGGSHKVALEADGLGQDSAWTVGAGAKLPIYYDPDAVKPYPPLDCQSDAMAEGFAGSPCTTDADCGGGCCLTAVEVYFMDGYCSRIDCQDQADCPSDSACVSNPHPQVPIASFCGKLCNSDADCRSPEYACLPIDGADVCRPNFW